MVEVDLWYNWEVELPELAYRLDVDEMEDGGFQGHHLGFWQLKVGTSSYREREVFTEEDKVSGDKCNSDALEEALRH